MKLTEREREALDRIRIAAYRTTTHLPTVPVLTDDLDQIIRAVNRLCGRIEHATPYPTTDVGADVSGGGAC